MKKRMFFYILMLITGVFLIVSGSKDEKNGSRIKEEMAEIVETEKITENIEPMKPIRFEWIDIPILDCDIESFDDLVKVVNDNFNLNERKPMLNDFEIIKVNHDKKVSLMISARIYYGSQGGIQSRFLFSDLPIYYDEDHNTILVFENYNQNSHVREKCLEKLFETYEVTFKSMEFDHPYRLK